MGFKEGVSGRRSIRGYKADPVAKDVIEDVIALETRVPGSMNTQPCHFYGISPRRPVEEVVSFVGFD